MQLKAGEAERKLLEDQLRHAQKMEAVGRLAGGIAHDFNNLLMAILSFCTFARDELSANDPARSDILEAIKAAQRAADLTRQLLAFSRQQIVQPRVLSVSELVRDTDKMLRRILGEDIHLVTHVNDALWLTKIMLEATDGLSQGETVEFGTAIHGAGKRLAKLVDNYLAYAETELLLSDEDRLAKLRRARIEDLSPIVADRARTLAAACGRSSDLHMDVVAAPATIHVDHVRKIAEELIANALAFSTPGSPVSVQIRLDEATVRLEVEDKGRGMTGDEIAAIGAWVQFGRRFYEQQGSGLGLAIARRLADIYGGILAVTSERGRGTTATVTIPRSRGEA